MVQRIIQVPLDQDRTLLVPTDQVALEDTDGQQLPECCCTCEDAKFSECLICQEWHEFLQTTSVAWPTGVSQATVECYGRGGAASSEAGGGGGGCARQWRVDKTTTALDIEITAAHARVLQGTTVEAIAYSGEPASGSTGGGGGSGATGSGGRVFMGGQGADGNEEAPGGGGGGAGHTQAGQAGWRSVGGAGGKALGGDGGDGGATPDGDDFGGGAGAPNGQPGRALVRIGWWKLPRQLQLSMSGWPQASFECETNFLPDYVERIENDVLWSNLNGTFILSHLSGANFVYPAIEDCEDARSSILLERWVLAHYSEDDTLLFAQEDEFFLFSLHANLDCLDPHGMFLTPTIQATLCVCQRTYNPGQGWSSWTCSNSPNNISSCGSGTVQRYAVPCSTQEMRSLVDVPALVITGECPSKVIDKSCTTMTTVTATARLLACP